jgi:cellulose biosynthesis protein BcsQ
MVSISLFNNKGGVGKTTLTCNVAAHFAQVYKKRVLLVDCDPQCNSTQLLLDVDATAKLYKNRDPKGKTKTILDVVRPIQLGDAHIDREPQPMLSSQNRFGVDVLPGHPRLSIVEDVLSQAWSEALGGNIGGIRKSNWCSALCTVLEPRYDIVFFDIGPSLGSLNRSVLLGTEFFVSPMGADVFSIFGVKNIADWLDQWLESYQVGLNLSKKKTPGALADYEIDLEPKISKGFAGYTVQQYIAKSKQGVRRPTRAYEHLLEEIPGEVTSSLGQFFNATVTAETMHLGDVPHMYSLVPLAQSANCPIRALRASDGLVGSQFRQAEKYSLNLGEIAARLAANIGVKV